MKINLSILFGGILSTVMFLAQPGFSETTAKSAEPVSLQKNSGFAVSVGLTGQTLFVPVDRNDISSSGSIGGQFFVGYKVSRLVAGLGLDISNFSESLTYAAITGTSTGTVSNTAFLVSLHAQFDILQSSDKKAALFAGIKFGVGSTVSSKGQTPELPPVDQPYKDNSNARISYQIAPGLRYWVHPQFALSFSSGLQVDHWVFRQDNPSGNSISIQTALGIFGTIGVLGVF